jgi:hypothetical protein
MSSEPGKVHIIGTPLIRGDKTNALQQLQGRDPDGVLQPFFAECDESVTWFDYLRPAFGAGRLFHERTFPTLHRNGRRIRLVA